jgi:hypothetical protein
LPESAYDVDFFEQFAREVGRRFRCTMRVDCGQLDAGAVIRPEPGEWHPRMPERLDEEELADWRAGRNAVYQLAALTIGARLAVARRRQSAATAAGPAIRLLTWPNGRRPAFGGRNRDRGSQTPRWREADSNFQSRVHPATHP